MKLEKNFLKNILILNVLSDLNIIVSQLMEDKEFEKLRIKYNKLRDLIFTIDKLKEEY